VPVAELPDLTDPDSFYDHQLVGLAAVLPDGSELGEVTSVRHEGTELLVVRRTDGRELLVPFVSAIVPEVDLAAGRLVVDPPEGLLDL
jgi:16S rRNA processing protein RimM